MLPSMPVLVATVPDGCRRIYLTMSTHDGSLDWTVSDSWVRPPTDRSEHFFLCWLGCAQAVLLVWFSLNARVPQLAVGLFDFMAAL